MDRGSARADISSCVLLCLVVQWANGLSMQSKQFFLRKNVRNAVASVHQEHLLRAVQNAKLVRCLVRREPVQLLQGADLVLEGVEEGATEGEVDVDVDGLLGMGGGPLHLGSGGDGDDEDDEGEPSSEEEEEEEEEEDPDGFGVEVILLALMSSWHYVGWCG